MIGAGNELDPDSGKLLRDDGSLWGNQAPKKRSRLRIISFEGGAYQVLRAGGSDSPAWGKSLPRASMSYGPAYPDHVNTKQRRKIRDLEARCRVNASPTEGDRAPRFPGAENMMIYDRQSEVWYEEARGFCAEKRAEAETEEDRKWAVLRGMKAKKIPLCAPDKQPGD
jgi:hypothetical protein